MLEILPPKKFETETTLIQGKRPEIRRDLVFGNAFALLHSGKFGGLSLALRRAIDPLSKSKFALFALLT